MADERNAEIRKDLQEFAKKVNDLMFEFQKKHGPPPILHVELGGVMGAEYPRVLRVHASVEFDRTG